MNDPTQERIRQLEDEHYDDDAPMTPAESAELTALYQAQCK